MSNFDAMFRRQGGNETTGASRRYGVDLAKVTNISDPDKLNRVKCKRVTNDPDVGETDWMYVCSPLAGSQYGLYAMPKVGDLVLLAYLGGDAHRPFVIGSLWTKEVAAPYTIADGKNETFSFKLPSGTEVVFSETKGKEKITIKTAGGNQLALDDENKKIHLTDAKGDNALTMDLNGGELQIQAKQKLSLAAGSGASIEMDGTGGKITIQSKTGIELKSAQLEAQMSGAATVKANGQLSLESSGITQVKGSMVKIN